VILLGAALAMASPSVATPQSEILSATPADESSQVQSALTQAETAADTEPAQIMIAAGTPVELELRADISSKINKTGEWFDLALAAPLRINDVEILPAGTPGRGQIVHAAKGGFGGGSGELLLAARYLTVGNQQIPLRKFRLSGRGSDNMAEAMIINAAVPIVGLLVSGGNITIASGTKSTAIVSAETTLAPATQ
jgi:hypothetical protein